MSVKFKTQQAWDNFVADYEGMMTTYSMLEGQVAFVHEQKQTLTKEEFDQHYSIN